MKEQSYQPIIPRSRDGTALAFTIPYPSLAEISLHQLEMDIG